MPNVTWKQSRIAVKVHVHRKVPIGYNGAPQIRPQKYPFPWTDPQTPLPASCLADAKRHPDPICRFPQCTGQTDAPTDRPRDCKV